MFGIQWEAPYNVIWLPVIIVIIVLYIYRWYKVHYVIKQLAQTKYVSLIKNFSSIKMWIKIACFMIACGALWLALLSPIKTVSKQHISQSGRNLYIALDVSRSMSAVDCKPSRLACAKEKIKQLVNQFQSERVGLILFAGSAFVYCPLTSDYQTFFHLLESVDLQTISSTNTALDKPILCALSSFEKSNAQQKLLILVTDGEDFGNRMESAVQQAIKHDLCVCVLGMGTTQGSPIPLYNEMGQQIGHQKDKDQKIVISSLQEIVLKKLANDLKGLYYTATSDDRDINAFHRFIEKREKEALQDVAGEIKEYYYHYCLLVALFFLIFEWVL